jgi:hypothetical protein
MVFVAVASVRTAEALRRAASDDAIWCAGDTKADGRLHKRDFIYIAKDDEYQVPAGQRSIYRYGSEENGRVIHRYGSSACPQCPMKGAVHTE